MSAIRIVRDYPQPPRKVWRAVTDPELIPLWTATGAGARPEGFAAVPGTTFKFVAKPKPGWSGVVVCEVLEVREPLLLRYSWQDEGGGEVTEVTYSLAPHGGGTRFIYDHTGFTGVGGLFMAKILGTVRTKMLTKGLPAVLNDLDDQGALRQDSPLRPKPL
ncbi:SRPBCC domain-containing protein [Streptomyces sp. NPDC060205]|uniref:SRPBCC family protein n=1 Tax=Streptomyces sp. NPDC060205 TaxID=3347072 RepID=UPI0036604D93